MNMMPPNGQKIVDAAKLIVDKTDNSLLILNLESVSKHSVLELQKELKGKTFKVLDVVLQTPGGDIDAAFIIAKLLRTKAEKLNIYVPLYAKSAGTLICLVADNLHFSELSELGPLDTQISEVQDGGSAEYISALNGFKALEQVQVHSLESLDIATKLLLSRSQLRISDAVKLATEFVGRTSGTMYSKLDPMKIGEYARWLEVGERYGVKLLTIYMGWNEEHAQQVVSQLVKNYPHHGYVLDAAELIDLSLPVKEIDARVADECNLLRDELLLLEDDLISLIEPSELVKQEGAEDAKK